jgi:hypothetical protein
MNHNFLSKVPNQLQEKNNSRMLDLSLLVSFFLTLSV